MGLCCVADDIPLLVAHLAYNFYVRVALFVYVSSAETLRVLEEDVQAGLECVEFLSTKLGLLQRSDGSDNGWQLWRELRQAVVKCVSAKRPDLVGDVKSKLDQVSQRFQLGLALHVSHPLVQLFNYVNIVQLTAGVCISGEMLVHDNIRRYMDCYDDMPSNCMSSEYMERVEKIRELMLKSFDASLTRPEVLQVAEIAVWQSRNFIYHFRPEVVTDPQCPLGGLLGMGDGQGGVSVQVGPDGQLQLVLSPARHAGGLETSAVSEIVGSASGSDNVDSDSGNEEEKVDESEKDVAIKLSPQACDADNEKQDVMSTQGSCIAASSVERSSQRVVGVRQPAVGSQDLGTSAHEVSSQRVAHLELLCQEVIQLEHALTIGMPSSAVVAIEEAIRRKRSEIDAMEEMRISQSGMQTHLFGRRGPDVCRNLVTLSFEFVQSSITSTLDCQKTNSSRSAVGLLRMLYEVLAFLPEVEVDKICGAMGVEADEMTQKMQLIRRHLRNSYTQGTGL